MMSSEQSSGVAIPIAEGGFRPLEPGERVEEIARMLGGTRVTDTTLRAARELVA